MTIYGLDIKRFIWELNFKEAKKRNSWKGEIHGRRNSWKLFLEKEDPKTPFGSSIASTCRSLDGSLMSDMENTLSILIDHNFALNQLIEDSVTYNTLRKYNLMVVRRSFNTNSDRFSEAFTMF